MSPRGALRWERFTGDSPRTRTSLPLVGCMRLITWRVWKLSWIVTVSLELSCSMRFSRNRSWRSQGRLIPRRWTSTRGLVSRLLLNLEESSSVDTSNQGFVVFGFNNEVKLLLEELFFGICFFSRLFLNHMLSQKIISVSFQVELSYFRFGNERHSRMIWTKTEISMHSEGLNVLKCDNEHESKIENISSFVVYCFSNSFSFF